MVYVLHVTLDVLLVIQMGLALHAFQEHCLLTVIVAIQIVKHVIPAHAAIAIQDIIYQGMLALLAAKAVVVALLQHNALHALLVLHQLAEAVVLLLVTPVMEAYVVAVSMDIIYLQITA